MRALLLRRSGMLAGAFGPLMLAAAIALGADGEAGFSPFVDNTGGITLPDPVAVRTRWNHLGTWAIQGDVGVKELHEVYTQPEALDGYRKSGVFPDGTVLVKEVRAAAHTTLTTGDVASSAREVLWFVMIKDDKARFRGNPLWAQSWGWALFLAEDPATNVATDFETDCMACHLPAQKTDWVYVEGYPALKDPP